MSTVHPQEPRADFGSRLGGLVLDLVIVGVPAQALFLLLGRWSIVLWPWLVIGYSTYFIARGSGQTVGMKVVHVRVIDARTGGRVRVRQALGRTLTSIVSWIACYLGYLWMLWDPNGQTWHDKAARTLVVPTAWYPVEHWPG